MAILKKSVFLLFIITILLVGCSSGKGGTKTTEKDVVQATEDTYKDYYGTYYKVQAGQLDGNYFDDYETVPLEDFHDSETIQLKSDGTYITKYDSYTQDGILFSKTTSKYAYKFDGFNVVRNRNINENNFKSQKSILLYDGEHYFKESVLQEYVDAGATVLKEDEGSIVYDITKWRIANNERDGEENHLENDFVTVDGLLISVNYYYDSDETKVSVYEKR